jgi:hypothetical protein
MRESRLSVSVIDAAPRAAAARRGMLVTSFPFASIPVVS